MKLEAKYKMERQEIESPGQTVMWQGEKGSEWDGCFHYCISWHFLNSIFYHHWVRVESRVRKHVPHNSNNFLASLALVSSFLFFVY